MPQTSSYLLRGFLSPDKKRTVACWAVYEDVERQLPRGIVFQSPETPLPAPYEMRQSEGKGRGLFATRRIKKGELIVRERPVIMIPQACNADDPWRVMEGVLLRLLYRLEQDDRERYVQLHNCKSLDECGPLAGILRTNSLGASFAESHMSANYCCVCLDISLVNHSCDENAHYIFEPKLMTFALRARREILQGDEITISYATEGSTYADRQAELLRSYKFVCKCPKCTAPAEVIAASDKRRRFILSSLESVLTTWMRWSEGSTATARTRARREVQKIEAFLEASEEEGVITIRTRVLEEAVYLYAVLADAKNFKKCCAAVLECMEESGEGEKDRQDWEYWMKHPKSFPMWNLCGLR